ncbi:GNVR domain-containing protein [Spirosoma sp. KNUC1025]|uniref:GNVR domain-containing protein n=1 Tax=Spirosoma sp. KNUC1025 TaxID=2894082 RepID=UPI00386B9DE5|nr:lipopolysaccharide biosynthesis protein [Spirosoma sp. KNUC1025]
MDVTAEKQKEDIDQKEIEIQLSDIIHFIKGNLRKIVVGGIVGLIIGALYAFSKPNVYKVEVTVMPEYQSRGAGGLGSLSVFSGFGMDNANANDIIRPDLYPNVLQSVPFALDLLEQKVYSKKLNTKTTLQDYINKSSSPSLFDRIMGLLTFFSTKDEDDTASESDSRQNGQAIVLSKEQYGLVKAVQGSVLSTFDRKTGILTITATEKDPIVTASIAQLSLSYLTKYITAYRTDKARKRVIFLNQQVREAKQRYQASEYALSNYRDHNRSIFLNTVKLEEQRLQADYLLEQSVYSDLAKQLEQAKIKVEEDTPTFKILEPPAVPLQKSGPKRTMIIFGCTIIGVVITLGFILIHQYFFRKEFI